MEKNEVKRYNRVKAKISKGEGAVGTFLMGAEAAYIEILGYAGFDFVIIDTEHAPNDISVVQDLIRAAEVSGLTAIVRVTKNDPSYIKRALDVGAGGILVPQVNTAAEAAAVIKAAKYAPKGERGLAGIVRAANYGFTPFPEYLEYADKQVLVITQVEHVDAVTNLDEILAVDGIDGIFIGPTDLSQSMGMAGQFNSPRLQSTIEQVIERGVASAKWAGIFCLDEADAQHWQSKGAQMVCIGTDTMLFGRAARSVMKTMQSALPKNKE
jgi:4-hydroxy-2-oxoheptanedioate aldolase